MELSAGAFREIVEEHQAMVFSLALRVVADRGLAEEVAQDVFFELHRRQAEVEDAGHVKHWLRRVAVHRAIDQVRSRAARPDRMGEEFAEEFYPDGAADGAGREDGRYFGLASRVESMVSSLPEVQRAVVTLRFQEDMDAEEIAQLMGMPVATAKSHLQRAMQLLRRKAAVVLKEYTRG